MSHKLKVGYDEVWGMLARDQMLFKGVIGCGYQEQSHYSLVLFISLGWLDLLTQLPILQTNTLETLHKQVGSTRPIGPLNSPVI